MKVKNIWGFLKKRGVILYRWSLLQPSLSPEMRTFLNSSISLTNISSSAFFFPFRGIFHYAQITITKLVALGLDNLSVSVSRNGERTRPDSLTNTIHDRRYWRSFWLANQKIDDVIDNQWNCKIGRIFSVVPKSYNACVSVSINISARLFVSVSK